MSGRNHRPRGGRRRFEIAGLVLALALVVSQSIGSIGASASSPLRSRERSGAFTGTTTATEANRGSRAPARTAVQPRAEAPAVLATTPIDSTDIDAFEGLISTGDPGDDSDWTPGNLCQSNVECYHELDNVPHRIILKNLTPGTEYTITVLIDFQDNAGHPGYDEINGVVGVSGTPDPAVAFNGTTTNGCGNATTCKSYTFTFTPTAANPEIRFNAHLAIGAHLFGGSSLSARILGSTKNVPLPVNDILLDIRAHKFNDLNGNGTQEQGEQDLAGWTMTLYSGPDCSGSPIDVTGNAGTDPNPGVTDASGNVDWTNLSASDGDRDGRFSVEETLQAGWVNTTPLCREVGIVANQNVAVFGNQQQAPSLSIEKSVSGATVQYGTAFSYTITVKNTGNAPATDVLVTDDLADALFQVSASYDVDPGSGADGTCSVASQNLVSCTIGTLAASDGAPNGPDEVVVTINAKAPSVCRTINNTAHVAWAQDTGNGLDSNPVSIEVVGCTPSLAITKSASAASVQPGGAFSYTVSVANTGNAEATGVVVTDDLDDSLTGVSASYDVDPGTGSDGACTVDPGNVVTCDVGTLAKDDHAPNGPDEVVVTISATAPDACGPIANTAHVASDQSPDGTDSDEVSVDVTGCAPDLTITKSASTGSVAPGGGFTWTITVVNAGNAAAADVVISDDLPDAVSGVSAGFDVDPSSAGGTGPCTVGGGNAVSCSVGTLAANDGTAGGPDTVQVTITVTAPQVCGPLENAAQVQMGTQAPISSNTSTVNVEGCAPSLTIEKSASSGSVAYGGAFSYTIGVHNDGNDQATGVVVTDDLDDSLTGVSASFDVDPGSAGGTGTCTVGSGNTISCPIGTLAEDDGAAGGPDEAVVTIQATAPTTCGTIVNTAHVSSDQDPQGSDSNRVSVDVTGCVPGLNVSKSGPASVVQGGTVEYHVSVSNTGNAASDPVTVTDTVPLSGVQASFSLNGGQAQPCNVSGSSVSCDLGSLQPGDSVDVTITGTAPNDNTCPTLQNTATVSVNGSGTDTNTVETTVTGCTTPTPPPPPPIGIQIVKGGPALAHVGDTITYTFDVSLTTPTPLSNVTVTDPICDAAPVLGSTSGGDTDDVLEAGEIWHYTCTHLVTDADPDPLPNTATVTGTSSDGRTATDQDSHLVDLIHPAIEIVKTADPTSGEPGDTITYTYVVTNIGDVTLYDISVDDDVIGHICDIASLDPGASETCTAEYVIPDQTGPIRNVGTAVGSDELGTKVKDDDRASVDVVLGEVITKTPPRGTAFTGASGVVPLAGLALLLLLAGSGSLFLSRRRRKGDAEA